jgi:UDP-N-acetylglucosamine/UDP-N-acetylgalactosamine diphosphorylase
VFFVGSLVQWYRGFARQEQVSNEGSAMSQTGSQVSLDQRYQAALEALRRHDQAHLLDFYGQLDEAGQARLLSQIEGIDWDEVARLIESHVKQKPAVDLPEHIEPAPYYPHEPGSDLKPKYEQAWAEGERLVREGKVAAFTVAGGQGTRLGWDGPKGTFPATPIRQLPLFGCFAEYLHNVQARFGVTVPWYIMTSPANDQQTRQFFHEQNYFGLDPEQLMFFPQQMMPAIDRDTGRVLLESKDSLALSPNGHGGSLKALSTSGALEDMRQRGVEQISYTQVDNPLVRMVDPLFVGLHALDGAAMSSKMLPKRDAHEKVGNFCVVDGRLQVIEYSGLPGELAGATDEQGRLRFRAGSIAIHVIQRSFVAWLNDRPAGFGLPWHRAEKKVAYLDPESEQTIKPEQPNAVKLETFVFDALPLCDASIVYQTERVDEFAPIKNADSPPGEPPAPDSGASSQRIQAERAGRWLQQRGVDVPRDEQGRVEATLEISQRTAIYAEDLASLELPQAVERGQQLLI